MLDHISIGVTDLARAGAFYDAVLGALGYARLFSTPRGIGYGEPGAKDEAFAILASSADARPPGVGCHIAFRATSREAVDAFHAAALGAGGVDEGAPGLRPVYGAGYYAAFVRDLDGYRIEAACTSDREAPARTVGRCGARDRAPRRRPPVIRSKRSFRSPPAPWMIA